MALGLQCIRVRNIQKELGCIGIWQQFGKLSTVTRPQDQDCTPVIETDLNIIDQPQNKVEII